jgi:predicted dehydrogenase
MENFRWGILGTGGIAQAFARDLLLLDGHSVAAVGSRTLPTAELFASEFPGCAAYGSYENLTRDMTIDAVYVATPHPFHLANTLLALHAGKPVLCEKPFAINTAQAKLMLDTAHTNNLALMEAMKTRFLPHIHKVREILAAGLLGEIHLLQADHGQRLAPLEIPRLMQPELAGGALLDLAVYPISLAHLVLGVPLKITASASFIDTGVDGQTSAIFDYPSGAQAVLTANMMVTSPCAATINGSLGRIEIDRTFYNPTNIRVILNDGTITEYPSKYVGHGLREQAQEFARVVRAGLIESPYLTHAETLQIMKSMDEVRRQINLRYPFE